MVKQFYTTYISVALGQNEIFHASVSKGGIKSHVIDQRTAPRESDAKEQTTHKSNNTKQAGGTLPPLSVIQCSCSVLACIQWRR